MEELEKLHDEIKKCSKCPLHKGRIQAVPGDGNPKADVFFIGEGPGAEEDKQGKPFVGAAGKFLDVMLTEIGWKRDDVFIGNIVKCRPPDNRDPLPEEIDTCCSYLEAQLEIIKPKIIVLLGRHAMYRFLPSDFKISKEHGKVFHRQNKFLVPLYHPAAALYHASLRQTLIDDFKRLPKIIEKVKEMSD
ncbi:uracil-DNA glycosylase [Patescibacteria group bacterium]|nr:uracil-DNA glycosylase [Patescibacteria group bacterium]